jgi:hypothetical protein
MRDITNKEMIKVQWCKLRNYTACRENGLSFLELVVVNIHRMFRIRCTEIQDIILSVISAK